MSENMQDTKSLSFESEQIYCHKLKRNLITILKKNGSKKMNGQTFTHK